MRVRIIKRGGARRGRLQRHLAPGAQRDERDAARREDQRRHRVQVDLRPARAGSPRGRSRPIDIVLPGGHGDQRAPARRRGLRLLGAEPGDPLGAAARARPGGRRGRDRGRPRQRRHPQRQRAPRRRARRGSRRRRSAARSGPTAPTATATPTARCSPTRPTGSAWRSRRSSPARRSSCCATRSCPTAPGRAATAAARRCCATRSGARPPSIT